MTPLPLLAALIVMKVRDCLVQKEKLPNITGESDQDVSIIKTKKMDHEMKMEESESKVKLVANGDANENCNFAKAAMDSHRLIICHIQ